MSCQTITEKLTDLKAKGTDFENVLINRGFEACYDIQKEVHKLVCEALYDIPGDKVELRGYLANRSSLKYKIPYISPFKEGRARATSISGFQYFIDIYGNDVFKDSPHSSFIEGDFVEGRARCKDSYGEYFIDEEGNEIGESYTGAEDYREGFAKVEIKFHQIKLGIWSRRDTRALFIDRNGQNIFDKEFLEAQSFSDGLASIRGTDGSWHYLNKQGEIAIEGPFAGAYPFHNGRAMVNIIGEGWCIIDKEGNKVGEGGFDGVSDFKEGFAMVRKGQNTFFINQDGQYPFVEKGFFRGKMHPQKYRGAQDFSEGYAVVTDVIRGDTFSIAIHNFINTRGERLLKRGYCVKAESFRNGFAAVAKDYKSGEMLWTFIDKTGKEITSNYFDDVGDFSENGLARVKKDGKWSFINSKGEMAFPESFYFADNFVNGIARVMTEDNKTYYIDSKGRYVMGEKPE